MDPLKCRVCGKIPEGPYIIGHQISPVHKDIYTVYHSCSRISIVARGDTAEEATENWNNLMEDK